MARYINASYLDTVDGLILEDLAKRGPLLGQLLPVVGDRLVRATAQRPVVTRVGGGENPFADKVVFSNLLFVVTELGRLKNVGHYPGSFRRGEQLFRRLSVVEFLCAVFVEVVGEIGVRSGEVGVFDKEGVLLVQPRLHASHEFLVP